uniref:Rab-GAP TBC domain-containing protein n=1 Tax=Mucochytrium quahogii TaxID=96639 RepID=A0A7S2R873_9STRA|mmetsp:Transcript_43392/g.69447  ORF Transcript_43392/g.69447 Transcript_43392/m.69447 type:complete len:595 (+) Transcript_43392:1370-3154(+)
MCLLRVDKASGVYKMIVAEEIIHPIYISSLGVDPTGTIRLPGGPEKVWSGVCMKYQIESFFEDVSVTKEIQGILETEDNSSLNKVLDEDDSVSVISSLPSLPEKSPKKGSNIFAAFAFVNAATGGGGASPKSLTTEKIALRDQVLDPFMRVVPKIIQAMRSANMHYDNVAYRCEVADWMLKVVFDYRDIQLSTSFRALSWVSLLDVYLEPADRNSPADPFAGGPIRVAATSELQYRLLQSRIGVEHQIDRQLLQDVPRCHQYHLLMRCTESRSTLRNVLKTWTLANPGSEYWQGLDSIAAAVVCIFNGNEPTIFAVFNKIIQTYLPGMFSSIKNKNSKLLHARLCVLEQLLAFHDPQLGLHLKDLGVKPDLYAIPWVLTLFSHVLPLPILCKLWDYLFLEAPEDRGATILFFSVSVLVQLRKTLFQLDDFGTCVGFLTRLPVRLDELVSRSIVLAEKVKVLTPKFLGLGVAPVFFDEENNVPIIPATELVKHWDETVVVETGEDILIREAIKFHEASVLDKVNALLVKDVKKRIVVFHNTDHDYQKLVSFLKIFFLGEKRPFLCVLEADALSTVEDIAPHLLDPDKVDRDVIEL